MQPLETAAAVLIGLAGGWFACWVRTSRARRRSAAEAAAERSRLETVQAEREQRLAQREQALDERARSADRQAEALREAEAQRSERDREQEQRSKALAERAQGVDSLVSQARSHASSILAEAKERLAESGGLSQADARRRLLEELDRELAAEKARKVQRAHEEARVEADARAREVVLTAVQRLAVKHASEGAVTSVVLPNDDMKGRVIGRDGRNVKAFEAATGCDVIVDETPGQVVVSCFDPVRREVARLALATLVQDGRIHPARIEEVVAESRARVDERLREEAQAALRDADVHDLHPDLVELLGRLAFRTSYGQNVLRHCVEVAHLAGAMAAELGLDARLARRAGLLHDIGKAVSTEAGGAHTDAAGDLVRRCGEPPEVVAAVEDHHDDLRLGSPYAVLAQVADAVSAGRPGARQEPQERYVKRLQDLETIAAGFPGVERAFAIQAGREIRVLVDADKVTDAMAPLLARDIARAVEEKVTFPGEVKVTVVREVRAVDVAR